MEIEVIDNLKHMQREMALEFALSHTKALTINDQEVAEILNDAWFFENTERISTIIRDASPSPARDLIIAELVRALNPTLPGEARAWAAAIADNNLRKSTEASITVAEG